MAEKLRKKFLPFSRKKQPKGKWLLDVVPESFPQKREQLVPTINIGVPGEAELLRRTGELLEMGRRISCPVVAIHGDWDPHPAEGVAEPLSSVLKSFEFILLANCGHTPWVEKMAKDKFYSILKTLIA